MNKEELRRYYLSVRKSLSEEFVRENSRIIIQKLMETEEFDSAKSFHSYISIKDYHEVETNRLLQHCIDNNLRLLVPRVKPKGEMEHVKLKSFDNLKLNSWGVPEPLSGDLADPEDPDLILVPMVAGDRQKNRLGYGKGYYDRFLAKTRGTKIGLLFNCQLHDRLLPVEDFDIQLDILITESKIIR